MPRLLIATDREAYRPGDTVHVEVKLAVKKRARSSLPRMRLSS